MPMIKRVVEIGSDCHLCVANSQLQILKNSEQIGKVPLEDLGVLVLDNPMISYTLQLLQQCAEQNVAVVFCDNKHMPVSLMQPVSGHSLHSRVITAQASVSEPTKKRIWQEIIKAKLEAQACTLDRCGVQSGIIRGIAKSVKSGDSDNRESQAALLYWKLLFGKNFKRDPDVEGINSLLNYGYAVVRATVARSIIATGLHPALGIHHHNQYDAFCLANDLMEPFRPSIDLIVWQMQRAGDNPTFSKETKRSILEIFESKWVLNDKSTPFIVAIQLFAAGVKKALLEKGNKIKVPVLLE